MDYRKIGLKVGLEIHQELATEHKMFCACPPKLFREEPEYTFLRRLRPSQSELGEVDPAALFEFMKGMTMVYEANQETSCLVEMDEEPPGPLNGEALDICLVFALMTGSHPVDEVHVMRKIVVDGSNTTGFQRTCVVSLGGSIDIKGRTFRLQQVCLEEDAARKIAEEGVVSRYRIDRLGIPLIEVTTAPDIRSPKEAEEVALSVGRILRATGKVRRGLGTIRQDVNISIEGGALIEIKGVQELNIISKVIEYEVERQVKLLELVSELGRRGVGETDLNEEFMDVSDIFDKTKSSIIAHALEKGGRVLALKLPKFAGVVGAEICPNRRLGTEMADRARFYGGVRGLFHTDELPAYDITDEEVQALRNQMRAAESDAIVIVANSAEKCRRALSAVVDRAKEALEGVPAETRSANPDGTTYFTRPRPGAARMYPETDVISIPITHERLGKLKDSLPEMPGVKLGRFKSEYNINEKLARQIIDSEYTEVFEELASETNVAPTLLAVTLTETFKSLARDGVKVNNLGDEVIRSTFALLDEGKTAKESLPQVFTWLAANPGDSPEDALRTLSLEMLTQDELKRLIEVKISENTELVNRMGMRALGPLMGMIMGEIRGRARAEDVQILLQKALASLIGE